MKTRILTLCLLIFASFSILSAQKYKDFEGRKSVVFHDDFNNNKNKWPEGNSPHQNIKIDNGYLFYEGKNKRWNQLAIPLYIDESRDFEIETAIRYVWGNDTKANALIWGASDEKNMFAFGFETSAYAKFCQGVIRDGVERFRWDRGKRIVPRGFNKLTVRKTGQTYHFFLNEKLVRTQLFSPFFGQEIGFAVYTPVRIQIDYLKISYLDSEVTLTQKSPRIFSTDKPKPVEIETAKVEVKNNNIFLPSKRLYSIAHETEHYVNKQFYAWRSAEERKLEAWKKQGEFEKTNDYYERMKSTPQEEAKLEERAKTKEHELKSEALTHLHNEYVKKINWSKYSVNTYDADRETYGVTVDGLRTFALKVPLQAARKFKEGIENLEFNSPRFENENDWWALQFVSVYNPVLNQSFVFSVEGSSPIVTNVQTDKPAEKSIPKDETFMTLDGNYDIESDLPPGKNANPDAIAVVIGNANYDKVSKVNYAHNDAQTIQQYLTEVMGFSAQNIFYVEDASKSEFELYFGKKGNPKGKLYNAVKRDLSDVFIFYSGHGAPGLNDKKGYFVPTDCDPNYVEITGYPLEVFYQNLNEIPARHKTVVIDACFSGTNIYKNISPIGIYARNSSNLKNGAVLSSSSAKQVSSWYNGKNHGLFTYFFLKAIHNQNADSNKNGELTLHEIFKYVSEENEGVPYYARRIHGVEQLPTLTGTETDRVLVKY